jgi:hypothetical protein
MDLVRKITHRNTKVFARQRLNRCRKFLFLFMSLSICSLRILNSSILSVSILQSPIFHIRLNLCLPTLCGLSSLLIPGDNHSCTLSGSNFSFHYLSSTFPTYRRTEKATSFPSAAVSIHITLPRCLRYNLKYIPT